MLLLFSLALLFVACGSESSTTTAAATTAAPSVTTKPPAVTGLDTTAPSTAAPQTTTLTSPKTDLPQKPKENPIDILWGDVKNNAATEIFEFRNDLSAFDFRWAFSFYMAECENDFYEYLFLTINENEFSPEWELNLDYKWVITIDGEKIEIENFDLAHYVTNGYVRLDLGDWQYPTDVDENGNHNFDIRIDIYDAHTEDLVFYAWFTDPKYYGKNQKCISPPIMITDVGRDPTHVEIKNNAETITAISGPADNAYYTYTALFDGKVQTKLFTDVSGEEVIWKCNKEIPIVSYSLVGTDNDSTYTERILTSWNFYGSANGVDWVLLDTQELSEVKPIGFAERNFKLDNAVTYSYFKLEPLTDRGYQLSEIILYT